jgi:hypothetical protein
MLGTDKSRGYCLEMICADFLAGAHLENGDPTVLLQSVSRMFNFLPDERKQEFLENVYRKAS